MGSFLGLLALIVAILAISRLNRVQRELETLRSKVGLLEKLGLLPATPQEENTVPQSVGRLQEEEWEAATESADTLPEAESAASPPVSLTGLPGMVLEETTVHPGPSWPIPALETVPPEMPAQELEEPPPEMLLPEVGARSSGTLPQRDLASLEAAIGGSWLNRIGIALLVVGIASALGYSLTVLGPAGKSAVATATSLFLIVAGVVLERREPYKFYARGLIGGGWAALYATAYAVHELDATRLIRDPRVGFALLLAVGTGMILHSLKYRNQGLTALAYGLAYAAIFMHNISAYTLVAAALLGAATVLHLARRRWYLVSLGGIAATYGSLYLWYRNQNAMDSGTLRLGLAALALDWLVFLAADFAREPETDQDRFKARSVGLLNALCAGLLSFLAWTSFAPGGGWEPLLILGLAYAATSTALRRLGRSAVHPIHSAAASLFLALAAARGLDREKTVWAWLVEAQALVLLGGWIRDRFHRLMGCALFIGPAALFSVLQVGTRYRTGEGSFDGSQLLLAVAACACFSFTRRRLMVLGSEERSDVEKGLPDVFSYGAFFLILLALWVQLPGVYVAPAATVLAVILFELTASRPEHVLRTQGCFAAAYATLMVLLLTLSSSTPLLGHPARVPACLVAVAGHLYLFLRQRKGGLALDEMGAKIRPAFSWVSTVLIALLAWLEMRPVVVAAVWMILALLLVEVGIALRESDMRFPGYLLMAAAHLPLVAFTLPAHDLGFPARVPVCLVVAAGDFYLFLRQRRGGPALEEIGARFRPALSWVPTGLVAILVWLEARPTVVGPVWMILALLLVEVGITLHESDMRRPGYLVMVASQVSLVMSNLTAPDRVQGWPVRVLTVAPAIVATYYLWWRLRALGGESEGGAADRVDESYGRLLSYLGALLAGLFFRFQFGLEGVALRWSAAMVALLVVGYLFRDADFRLQAYGLAGAVLVRAAGFDFRQAPAVLGIDGALAVAMVSTVCFAAAGFVVRRRRRSAKEAHHPERRALRLESRLEQIGPDLMWLLAVALAAVYFYRTRSGSILIVAWALEGLLVTGAGFALKSRPLRLSGLGLLGLGLVLTLYRAFRYSDTIGRIVTFIVLGVILLLVSFGYARYRDSLRKAY